MFRRWMQCLAMVAAVYGANAHGQGDSNYPARPVTILVPAPPGGGTDTLARIIGDQLAKSWRQPVVVENVPGAGGVIASSRLVRSAPDGHTLLLVPQSHEMNAFFGRLPYDTLRDFTPVKMVARTNSVILVSAALGLNSFSDLLKKAAAEPGKYAYGSTEASSRLTGELLRMRAGMNVFNAPYKGAPQMITDVINGQLAFTFSSVPAAVSFVSAGRVKPVAIVAAERAALLPDVPTLKELGVQGMDFDVWYGVLAPARMGDALTERIASDFETALADPEVQRRIKSQGMSVGGDRTKAFAATIAAGHARWKTVVENAGIHPE